MRFKSIFYLLSLLFSLAACSTSARLDSVRNDFANAKYEKLAADEKSENLELLVGAHAEFAKNEFDISDNLFEAFNKRNIDPTKSGFISEVGKLAFGQMAGDYKPYMMDYLFVSYYQLWDAILAGRGADARVIINQSYERQKKMSMAFAKLIANREKSELADKLKTDTSQWSAYSDIMNPALTYLGGLYFLNIGEHENARQYFARASGMVPDNKFVAADLNAAESGRTPNNIAWVFIETGFAPRLREKRLDIPWPVGNQIQVVSIATSSPEMSPPESPPIGAQLLADTNAMFLTEYKEYQINEALRAFAKTVSNIAIQSVVNANDKSGGWWTLASSIYAVATTTAEIRSWVTLPGHIYLLRVAKDKSGLIKLNSSVTINVEFNGNDLIYIRGNDIKQIKLK